jgi:hypothetical protein
VTETPVYTTHKTSRTMNNEFARLGRGGTTTVTTTISALIYAGVALWLVLTGMYLLIYRGHPLSIDEISIFDSIGSLVNHGTLARTMEFYRAPYVIGLNQAPTLQPLYEPLQVIVSSPLYWLASRVPQIGQFHTVYLSNIIITALTGVSFYIIALLLDFRLRVAWLGALTFGLATLALPYSRWLFREPLMGLFTLWAFYLAVAIQQRIENHQPYLRLIFPFILAILGMIFTKQVSVVFLPAFGICLIPTRATLRRVLPVMGALGAVLAVLVAALLILRPEFGDARYSLERWLNPSSYAWQHMLESTLGYLISPSRSFWLYSPVLLLSFIGAAMLVRRGKWRLTAALFFALLSTGAAYGALRLGTYWNGGWSWGPRYMLPLVAPFMLLVLPVLDHLLHPPVESDRQYLAVKRAAVGVLIAVSVGVQLLALVIPYTDLYNELDRVQTESLEEFSASEAETLAWLPENWSWAQSSIPYHLSHLQLDQPDTAWRFAPSAWLPLLLIFALLLAGSLLSAYALRGRVGREKMTTPVFLAAISGCVMALGIISSVMLWSLRNDGRYIGSRQDVVTLIGQLNSAVRPDDVVFINGNEYMLLFMNWFKNSAYTVTLPYPQREDYQPGEPKPTYEQLVANLGDPTVSAINWAGRHYDRVWMVMQTGPFIPFAMRPLEQYGAAVFYPAQEITVSQQARAVLFAVPPADIAMNERVELNPPLLYDERMQLASVDFPAGRSAQVGELIPLSLNWTPAYEITVNYQVSVQLLSAEDDLILGRDSLPQGGFGLTISWPPGEPRLDHHALLLPETLPPGEYTVQVVLYDVTSETQDRFPVRQGDHVFEGAAAPITQIQVSAP